MMMTLVSEANMGEQPTQEEVSAYAESLDLHFPVVFEPQAFPGEAWTGFAQEHGSDVPLYLVFDRDQMLRSATVGHNAEWIGEAIAELMLE